MRLFYTTLFSVILTLTSSANIYADCGCAPSCGCDQILFQANLNDNSIAVGTLTSLEAIEDFETGVAFGEPTSLETGADFVTAFGGVDFSYHSIKNCGIEVRPANGLSFTLSVPTVPNPGPVIGGLFDHVKFLAYSLFRLAPDNGCDLCTTWVGSASQLGVDSNPFGAAAPNPHADPRLACSSFASLDPNTLTTFDWIVTDDVIYVIVERLPVINTTYAAYSYLIPVGKRNPTSNPLNDVHTFKTRYNKQKGTMTWELDGRKVFRITEIGSRLTENNAFVFHKGKPKPLQNPTRFQTADHGGTDEILIIDGLQTGIALFTLLDWYPAQTSLNVTEDQIINSGFYEGLVRLESSLYRFGTSFYYYNPLLGGQATFLEDSALVGTQYQSTIPYIYRIFGQGAALRLFEYKVSLEQPKK